MAPQDSFIDDEDDTCPLCIEEFDLSDRNFRPCPCGYQICQFCFNNLKNNLNGLCPACRRPYDEKTIQWKVVTHEEIAEFRANIQKNQKKRAAEQRQKEVQKREVNDKSNRKNLVGVRVVQKNLVYVTGLTPTVPEDELLKTLRKQEFFGQYGNIQKISISNRKAPDGQPQSLGIYVTFEKKDDAARCIQAVNGSQNGDRVLKAQLGTTKYCSAWLRHEQCGNRQCMFLHELGDEEDSYTRQDLSSLNSVYTQRPLSNAASSSRSVSRQQFSAPQQSASQPMVRTSSKEGSDAGDGPALPASANWARTTQQRSRRGSHATSGAASSPAISNSLPVTTESAHEAVEATPAAEDLVAASTAAPTPTPPAPANAPAAAPSSRKAEKQPATESRSNDASISVKPPAKDPFAMPNFAEILKSLAACPEIHPSKEDDDDSFPPLFDPYGGLKRRAVREDEENRLGDQEDQPDTHEPSEGEPESGSLALGGEPEDRDQGREGSVFDQRRNSAQPPIQRSTADDLFGPSLGSTFAQGSGNIGSIGSRKMTPQQFIRPQGSFVDQMPPGISIPQSTLFQGQGHSRQQSRFSFANENASGSTKVNLTANPRLMAQQTSMMPTSFHSQPGSQFYASSSMPGPPGLKSTGTPPSSGGMFGQGHAFGGSGFGAASKDTSSELLQNLIRGRGGVGSSHAQDAGKREYFSTFHNQYPPSSSSSTPAPASGPGLMASLYGTQPGAFQDFGPKQKKKGKKHRHANTSSSGGSALVDLADPSILRMQHQQQGNNTGAGQGLFGGQSQDDDLLLIDESSIDDLVADTYPAGLYTDVSRPSGSSTPAPPGFASDISRPSGASTPAPPPGLGFNHAYPLVQFGETNPMVPPVALRSPAIARPSSHAVPRPVTPVTPLLPKAGLKRATKADTAPGSSDAKRNIKDLAVESGLSKDIAAQASSASQGGSVLQEEDFPALDSTKAGSPSKVTPALPAKVSQGKSAQVDTSSGKLPGSRTGGSTTKVSKRPTPGILDIAAATKTVAQSKISSASGGPNKNADANPLNSNQLPKVAASSALPTPTPTTATFSPIARVAPKTLRLVQTPKGEMAPVIGPSSVAPVRAAAHRPATPVSEATDTASVASASVSASRTNSPPPSKVGSAALRTTTKAQQRKQRNKASKEATNAIIYEAKQVEEEAEVAPVVGRKKKQKKEKKEKISGSASPAVSRPETPVANLPNEEMARAAAPADKAAAIEKSGQKGRGTKKQTEVDKPAEAKDVKAKDVKTLPKSPPPVDTSIRLNESTKTTVLTPGYGVPIQEPREEPDYEGAVGEIPSMAEILQSLIDEGELPDPDQISLFNYSPFQHYRADLERYVPSLPPTVKSAVTKEDEAELAAFRPVRKIVNGHRVLLTPNGDFVTNLTREEEDRYLVLQARVAKNNGLATAFVAPKSATGTGFSLIKGRAVPNGMPSFFPNGPGSFPSDPVGKMHREEAIGCINQHVLPSLNLGSYKPNSSAPNANGVNLQSLAPWISGADKDGKRPKLARSRDALDSPGARGSEGLFSRLENSDGPTANWDDDNDGESPSPAIGSTPLMSVEEAEEALVAAKKQHEALDKKFKQGMARLRRQFGLPVQ